MKRMLTAIFLLAITGDISANAQDNTFLRFVCQGISLDAELKSMVAIVEQLSVKRIGQDEIVNGADMINRAGKTYTGKTPFRMRIYHAYFASYGKAKEEIVKDLLRRPANKAGDDILDFTGAGSRLTDTFGFDSDTPFYKSLIIDLKSGDRTKFYGRKFYEGSMSTANAAVTMIEDGFYECESTLFPSAPHEVSVSPKLGPMPSLSERVSRWEASWSWKAHDICGRHCMESGAKSIFESEIKLQRQFIREQAERGDVSAQAYLALRHISKGNEKEGLQWYRRVVERTDADTLLKMGYDYLASPRYPVPATMTKNIDAYLWLMLGIARHPDPGLPAVEQARHDLEDILHRVSSPESLMVSADRIYYTLIRGDATAQRYHIHEVQQLLHRLGHSPGPIDGKWGARSDRAFAEWLGQPRSDRLSAEFIKSRGERFTAWMRNPALDDMPPIGLAILREMRVAVLAPR